VVDERLSSIAAKEQLPGSRLGKQKLQPKKSVDHFAAPVIRYFNELDSHAEWVA